MLQQNYEAIERRIALKLFKGIKQLEVPQSDMSLQSHNFLFSKWQTLKLQLQNSLNYVNRKLQNLEHQITKLKLIIYGNYKKDIFDILTTARKSIKQNNLKKNSLSSLNFKSVPILRFNSDDKQEDLLSDLYEQVSQNAQQVNQKQYSFCIGDNQNKIITQIEEDQKKLKNQTKTPKKELSKINFDKNLKKQQIILFDQKKTNKKSKQFFGQPYGKNGSNFQKLLKQFGVNTTIRDLKKNQEISQGKIGVLSKATAAQAYQEQNQNQKNQNSLNKNQIQQLKQQIRTLKKIIMTTHHIHFFQFDKLHNEAIVDQISQSKINLKTEQPQYLIKIQHYKNQNLDLRNMILQLRYELQHKQNQIQEYESLLIKLKQSIKQIKNQIYSELLPCQYCSFKSYIDLKIQEDNDKFGIKNT